MATPTRGPTLPRARRSTDLTRVTCRRRARDGNVRSRARDGTSRRVDYRAAATVRGARGRRLGERRTNANGGGSACTRRDVGARECVFFPCHRSRLERLLLPSSSRARGRKGDAKTDTGVVTCTAGHVTRTVTDNGVRDETFCLWTSSNERSFSIVASLTRQGGPTRGLFSSTPPRHHQFGRLVLEKKTPQYVMTKP